MLTVLDVSLAHVQVQAFKLLVIDGDMNPEGAARLHDSLAARTNESDIVTEVNVSEVDGKVRLMAQDLAAQFAHKTRVGSRYVLFYQLIEIICNEEKERVEDR